ncbi:flagellar export chaperone FliS [Paenibacillus sp. P2(2022)]|uniref:flagellar export chaperone FliS n=1 Tax=Paenibacillus TaxID=44249 RepID=UPI0005ED237D|nr:MULTISPECIES: flagellar export chaperone FliS [Paenibacillus]AUS28885.1 flagellar biosynthesis protein FliS [Paenibacillus polymyxa]KAE8559449.1 flagellar export chaperone FliS [Paenibacillus polymyxa]KJK29949.1 flagellar biosynthesis protein FliS [Paenibacillus polymyxa]MCJ1221726.1 flagellar export chaperone FliS [Paenibacillus polymyxa]MDG0054441.1 flagellar export chaperone FliS [Paenibacillus sp. P2(2022)]
MINSPYQKYQQTQAQTASKPKLLIMLYDGAIRFVQAGIEGIEQRDYEKTNVNLCKAQAIVHELISALNFDYPLANDLVKIYEYMLHCLIQANIHKEAASAEEVMLHLKELREAWVEASKSVGAGFGV